MNSDRRMPVLSSLLLAAACAVSPSCAKPEAPPPEPAREAPKAAAAPHWDYGTEHGPAAWASLSPDFAACGTGLKQSPIDLTKAATAEVPNLRTSYSPAQLRIIRHEHVADGINNGHTVQVNYAGADALTLGDEVFPLVQYHFHAPSEHTVDGRHYPMEMHLVHKSAGGKLAVLGVLVEEGAENDAFAPVWANLPAEKGKEFHLAHVTVDTDALLPKDHSTWRYDGSLTTPPCTEGVQWIVFRNPIQLSTAQVAAFKAIHDGNNRPIQPLNGRTLLADAIGETTAK